MDEWVEGDVFDGRNSWCNVKRRAVKCSNGSRTEDVDSFEASLLVCFLCFFSSFAFDFMFC